MINIKFNVEIDMDQFGSEFGFDANGFYVDLKEEIKKEISRQLIEKYFSGYNASENIDKLIKETVNAHLDNIIKAIVDKVSNSVIHKKRIAEITPRASVLAAVSEEDRAYFNTQIEKCIAKKFKS